jgi:hypothetical protein
MGQIVLLSRQVEVSRVITAQHRVCLTAVHRHSTPEGGNCQDERPLAFKKLQLFQVCCGVLFLWRTSGFWIWNGFDGLNLNEHAAFVTASTSCRSMTPYICQII